MSNLKNIIGKKYNRLEVISREKNSKGGQTRWLCKCDCGNTIIAFGVNLRNGHTQSCGCLQREQASKVNSTHGKSKSRLHNIWKTMKQRCVNPNNHNYKNYGGRGITICEEWEKDYLKFEEWALKNGYDENAKYGECTIDRIDVNGNYEPSNCRWVTQKEQARNKRNCRYVFFEGEKYTLAELSEILEVPAEKVYRSMNKARSKKCNY